MSLAEALSLRFQFTELLKGLRDVQWTDDEQSGTIKGLLSYINRFEGREKTMNRHKMKPLQIARQIVEEEYYGKKSRTGRSQR